MLQLKVLKVKPQQKVQRTLQRWNAIKKDDKSKEGADKKPDEKKPAEKKPLEKIIDMLLLVGLEILDPPTLIPDITLVLK